MQNIFANKNGLNKHTKMKVDREGSKKLLTGYPSVDKTWLKYYPQEVIEMELPKMNIYDYLYQNNKEHLTKVALNYLNNKITYQELFDNIDKTASAFISMGVKKGDIITVSLPMIPESIYIFYALAKIGAISNMIDPRTNENGIKSYIDEVDSKIFVTIDEALPNVNGLTDKLDTIIAINAMDSMPVENEREYANDKIISWPEFLRTGNIPLANNTVYEESLPISIVHTGGTTGFPKGVLLTSDNYNSLVEQFRNSGLNFQKDQTWLGMIPLFFAYGGGIGLHHPLSVGMEVQVIPMFDPEKMDDLILQYKPNNIAIIPSYYKSIINSSKTQDIDFSFFEMPACGSDRLDPSFEKEINDFLKAHGCDKKIVKGYGMSEVSSAICACVNDECNKIGSVGIPFSHSVISIFNPETEEELQYGEIGEICMTGPNVMLGYYNNEEETNKVMKVHEDGLTWIHSGDLGYMDEDGNLFVEGRMKRMIIKNGGFKVFPSFIEKTIMEIPMVESASVVGMVDPNSPEFSLSVANIVLKDEFKDNESEILEYIYQVCTEQLTDYSVPDYFKTRDNLPLTPAGKIDIRTLQQEANEEFGSKQNIKKLVLEK